MNNYKSKLDDIIKEGIKSSVQTRINPELISTVAAQAARDIRVKTELDLLLKQKPVTAFRINNVFWINLGVILFVSFIALLNLLTIDSQTLSNIPEVIYELELANNSMQIKQITDLMLVGSLLIFLVLIFILIPMWNNLKRLGKI